MIGPVRCIALALVGLVLLPGCHSLDRFDTSGKEPFTGCMTGAPFAHQGMLAANERPLLEADLRLDIDSLFQNTNPPRSPGRLSTKPAQGLCAPDPLFDDAPLRLMKALQYDALSLLTFGDGRDYSFMAWVDSTCQGTMLAVVSLMHDNTVELRLLKPAPEPDSDAGPEASPGFGVFRLDQRDHTCNP